MEHSIYKKINGSDKALFSKRLVSGMMFRRQSNQSAHAGVEISQRGEGGKGKEGGRKAQSFDFFLSLLMCFIFFVHKGKESTIFLSLV